MANYFDYDYLSELVQDADPVGVPVAVNLFLHKQDNWPHEEIPYIIVVAPGKGRRTLRWYWKVEDTGSGIIEGCSSSSCESPVCPGPLDGVGGSITIECLGPFRRFVCSEGRARSDTLERECGQQTGLAGAPVISHSFRQRECRGCLVIQDVSVLEIVETRPAER